MLLCILVYFVPSNFVVLCPKKSCLFPTDSLCVFALVYNTNMPWCNVKNDKNYMVQFP